MPIQQGQAPDPVEVNKIILKSGILALANQTKFLKDVSLLGGATGVSSNFYSVNNFADGQDYLVEGFGSDDTIDSSNTTLVADNEDYLDYLRTDFSAQHISRRAYICKVLDQFNNSSIDAGIWSTVGTVSEDTEKIIIGGTTTPDTLISDGVSGFDARSFAGDSEIIFHTSWVMVSSGGAGSIQISNGSTHVEIHALGQGVVKKETIRVAFDKSGENAYISINDGAFSGAIDISSVTTNWYIRFVNGSGGSGANNRQNIFFIGFVDGDAATVDYVSATKTFNDTKSNAIATWDTNSSLTINGFVSANGGSNYNAATKDTWTTINNTGTTAKIKLTCTIPTSITGDGTVFNIPHIKAVGGYFDG